jgi:hypothetical protein
MNNAAFHANSTIAQARNAHISLGFWRTGVSAASPASASVKASGTRSIFLPVDVGTDLTEMSGLALTLAGDLISVEPRVPLLLWELLK